MWNYIQSFESKDNREIEKREYFDKGILKNEYDQAFLMTYIANRNLINSSSRGTLENIVNQMMKRLINNLLDSTDTLDEDKIKIMFSKQCDIIKSDNKRKYENVSNILSNRFSRENKTIDNIFDELKGD